MPHPNGGTMVGKTGNGYARITIIGTEEDIVSLTLNGEEEISILVGDTYEDEGATLIRNNQDVSEELTITGEVDINVAGIYTITYSYRNYSVTRTVEVKEPLTNQEIDFSYLGSVQTYVVPQTGRYKLETWGASRTEHQ